MSYEIVIVIPTTVLATLDPVGLGLKYWDTLEKIFSIFLKFILFFRIRAESLQRAFVASDIQGRINEFVGSYTTQGMSEIIPYRLKVEWTKESTREEFIKRGELVVRMKYHEDQDKNFVVAVVTFFSKCLIPRARHYIDRMVLRGAELYLSKKVLVENRLHSGMSYFLENILDPELAKHENIRGTICAIENLEGQGWLNRILLREYTEMAQIIYPKLAPTDLLDETRKFLDFLDRIATKEPDKDVELDFRGKYIRMAIILVARLEVISEYGLQPYVQRIKRKGEENVDNIYITAVGPYNVAAVERITKIVTEDASLRTRFERAFSEKFRIKGKWADAIEGEYVKTICVGLRNKTQRPIMRLD